MITNQRLLRHDLPDGLFDLYELLFELVNLRFDTCHFGERGGDSSARNPRLYLGHGGRVVADDAFGYAVHDHDTVFADVLEDARGACA